jgi:hypothetical protein
MEPIMVNIFSFQGLFTNFLDQNLICSHITQTITTSTVLTTHCSATEVAAEIIPTSNETETMIQETESIVEQNDMADGLRIAGSEANYIGLNQLIEQAPITEKEEPVMESVEPVYESYESEIMPTRSTEVVYNSNSTETPSSTEVYNSTSIHTECFVTSTYITTIILPTCSAISTTLSCETIQSKMTSEAGNIVETTIQPIVTLNRY